MKFKNMFSPIQIGPMTVKNRFVVPPMGNNFANSDGTWSDESVAYYVYHRDGKRKMYKVHICLKFFSDSFKFSVLYYNQS